MPKRTLASIAILAYLLLVIAGCESKNVVQRGEQTGFSHADRADKKGP
jgi:hypothetical protein